MLYSQKKEREKNKTCYCEPTEAVKMLPGISCKTYAKSNKMPLNHSIVCLKTSNLQNMKFF